jgi:hypothetical protein
MSQVNFNKLEAEISNLRVIPTKDAKGNINGRIIVIETVGNAGYDITRTEGQFLTDLRNSFPMKFDHVQSLQDENIADLLGRFKRGTVKLRGSLAKVEANSEYVLDENSREVKSGAGQVGEKRLRKRSQMLVESGSFIDVIMSDSDELHVKKLNAQNAASKLLLQELTGMVVPTKKTAGSNMEETPAEAATPAAEATPAASEVTEPAAAVPVVAGP